MSKKILILSTELGTERDELKVPRQKLAELGHEVTLATPDAKPVKTMAGDKEFSDVVEADKAIADVNDTYDVIVLPGGTLNADAARVDKDIVKLVTDQAGAGRAIAAICHAPWVLVEAGLAKGKTLTSYESIRTDLRNAGATVKDESAVTCTANGWTLVTSRNPDDLDDFVSAIDAL